MDLHANLRAFPWLRDVLQSTICIKFPLVSFRRTLDQTSNEPVFKLVETLKAFRGFPLAHTNYLVWMELRLSAQESKACNSYILNIVAFTSFLGWGSHVLHLIPASKVQAHYPAALLRATRLSQIQKRKLVGHRDRAGPCIILRLEESRGSVTSLRSKIKIYTYPRARPVTKEQCSRPVSKVVWKYVAGFSVGWLLVLVNNQLKSIFHTKRPTCRFAGTWGHKTGQST